ncbi:MAG: HIT domain-containing protein [Patescibacteria group bacterium]
MFSNPRLMKGHLLVIPNRHVTKLGELTTRERRELWETVMRFQARITSRLASGCDLRQNYRPFQKQDRLKINHLHIHLQPRELKDELYRKCQIHEKKLFKMVTDHEIEEIMPSLRYE